MSATVLEIVEKVMPIELYPSVPQNFVVREGESIPAQVVLENPNVSLYCLDDEHQRALFVETPPGVDLARAPFFFAAQYQQSQRLIAVPYDSLHQLADDLGSVDDRLIFIYSTGRCGSTLISQSLNGVEGVVSYSEPDVYTQITMMRSVDNSRDDDYTRLLKSCTRVFCQRAPKTALKFRANVTHIGDLLYRAFPAAKNLFLYRNAETWLQSMTSTFAADADVVLQDPLFLQFVVSHAPLTDGWVQRHSRPPGLNEAFALVWLSILDKALTMHDQGIPYLAVRYEEIKAQPKRTLAEMFRYCGVPLDAVDSAYAAFAKDSQEGTPISRAKREQYAAASPGADDYAQVRAILQEHPVIQSPDFIVPNTVILD